MDTQRQKLIRKWEEYKPPITPVVFARFEDQEVSIKDESQNLTDTYKARHGWMLGLHYLLKHFPHNFLYYLGSTGNAGIADFAYADLLNNLLGEDKVIVANFYPQHYDAKLLGPDSKGRFTDGKRFRKEMEKYRSGRLIQVDFRERYWFDDFKSGVTPCLDKMIELGLDVSRSLDITEGFKPTYCQVMQEYAEQIKHRFGKIPKTLLVVQYGAGMLYDDSKLVVQGLPIDVMAISSGDPKTIADKICDVSESWQKSIVDLREIGYTTARSSGDKIYHVTEQEILFAMQMFKEIGIEAEPSGAAGMGIVPRLRATNRDYDLVAVINTGNGIKKTAFDTLMATSF